MARKGKRTINFSRYTLLAVALHTLASPPARILLTWILLTLSSNFAGLRGDGLLREMRFHLLQTLMAHSLLQSSTPHYLPSNIAYRYGGLGNHRTPTGFSGDTLRKWSTLEYEIWFTPRASNVGFGWWSHDIGGFSGSFVDADWHTEPPELFLRWLQFGALSPIMRTHCRYCDQVSRKHAPSVRSVWLVHRTAIVIFLRPFLWCFCFFVI